MGFNSGFKGLICTQIYGSSSTKRGTDRFMTITTTLIRGVSCGCVDATQKKSLLNRPPPYLPHTFMVPPRSPSHSIIYTNVDYGYHTIIINGVKRPERGADRPSSSSAEVKERVELYLYTPSGSS